MVLIFLSKPVFSQETAVLSQTIRGQVVDKETQTTLTAATVVILNTEPVKATITDRDGFFRIENVPVGRFDIQVSFIGYKTLILSEVQVTASKEIVLKVQLQEEAFSLETVTVKAYKNKTGNH